MPHSAGHYKERGTDMATFPTLSNADRVKVKDYTMPVDPTVRTQFENGYVQTRARYTRLPKKWSVVGEMLTTADKDLIASFEVARGVGGEEFTWTAPHNSTSYTVRFASPVVYTPIADTNFSVWNVEMVMEEV